MNREERVNPLWRLLAFWMAVGFLLFELWSAALGCLFALVQPVDGLAGQVRPGVFSEPGPDHYLRLLPYTVLSGVSSLLLVAGLWRISGRGLGALGERLAGWLNSPRRVAGVLAGLTALGLVLRGVGGYVWAERFNAAHGGGQVYMVSWTQWLWGLRDLPIVALAFVWLPRANGRSNRRAQLPVDAGLELRSADWRDELLYDFGLPEAAVKELESHVMDAVDTEVRRGRTRIEAFESALDRLGSSEAIVREFRRANPEAIWAPRVLGMVGGSLLLSMAVWAGHMVLSLVQAFYFGVLGGRYSGVWLGSTLVQFLAPMLLGAAAAAGLLAVVASGRLATWGERGRRWFVRMGWIPVAVVLVMTGMMGVQVWTSPAGASARGQADVWSLVIYVVSVSGTQLLCPLLLGMLYGRLGRRVLPAG